MPRTRIEIIPHLDYAELTQRYRRCRDVKERTRWLVIRLLSRPGNPMKVEQVASITGLSADWVRKIARRYNATGAQGIVDAHKKSPGGKHKALTKEQLQELVEKLQSPPKDGGLWSGPKVGELIQQQFGIRIHRATAWKYLKHLGFSLQAPRPLHERSATPEQRAFFKEQLQFFVQLMRWLCPHKHVEVWAQDEARLGLKPVVRRTWALKGQRPTAHHYPRYKWLYTYGFVHPQTGNSCLFILPRVNTTVMQIALDAFAAQVNSTGDKLIILLVDQAGWHTTRHLTVPQDIIMYSIPPYTPQLNPTECLWPLLRERLANQVFDTLDSLETVLIERCQWLMNNPSTVKGEIGFSWLCSI
jgi:transposase